ncbi:serine/threonine-protein kinase CDG1-like [Euphorbia lathyris]|uniref:serine/threonine-protein kinase CDG1-like n=1 Tax=Euphorbia lathyris TaxID=212925 RepID=UPI0033143625
MVQANGNWGRESVMVVMDTNKNKGNMDALYWALKHVVRRRDTVIVLGVSTDFAKKNSCFPLNMGITISGIWERLEFSTSQGQGEIRPRELGQEIERKKEEYQNNLQPFYRQCKKNQVNMEVKLAFGFCMVEVTVKQAQNSNPRWIVLDSYLKKHKVMIYAQVGCNIAVMKGKDVATLTPAKAPLPLPNQNDHLQKPDDENPAEICCDQSYTKPQSPCWYPLSWRSGYPRAFSQAEMESITNGFAVENFVKDTDNVKVYEGVVEGSPVIVRRFSENDDRFWRMLKILSRVRHRNISNLVGYCCTGTCAFMLFDYPCLGTLAFNLLNDESAAKNLPWKARWYIAVEIGASLRYLHEECVEGETIVHLSVSSAHVVFSSTWSTMLTNFITAEWIKDDDSEANSTNLKEEEGCSVDVHDYGMFLIELITGKTAAETSLIQWALPLLENGLISEVLDPRLEGINDIRVIHMVKAALLCLKNHNNVSMSEVLAVVRGDQLAVAKC